MRALFAGLLILRCAATLSAQQPDSIVPPDSAVMLLHPIEVIASLRPSAGPNVRATAAGHVHHITSAQLRAWRPLTATHALRSAAVIYDDLGSPLKLSAIVRGFTVGPIVGMPQGVSVFIDGVPMNEPGSGDVAFDLLPLEHVERIEVLTGTASLLGPNSLGGAINFITRRGGTRTRVVDATFGSHRMLGVIAYVGGGTDELEYYAGGGHERQKGWRRRMSDERSHFFATFGKHAAEFGARAQVMAAHSYAQTAGSLPLSVYSARPDSNLTAGDFESLRQAQLALSGYRTLFRGLASVRTFARINDAERFNVNQEADPDVRAFSSSYTFGGEADWRVTTTLNESTLFLRAGVGGSVNRTTVELFAERVDPGQTTEVQSPITRYDSYAVADWQWRRFTVSGGMRFDLVHVPFRNLLNPERDTTSTFVNWSPRASITVRTSARTSAYASVARGFRAPALIEIACADPAEPCPLPFALGDDPPIDPVRVLTFEGGMRYVAATFEVQATAYRSDVTDEIFLFPYQNEAEPNHSTIDGYFGNIPRTRRAGVELNAHLRLNKQWTTHANYSVTRATFQTDDVEIFSIREAAGLENEVKAGDRFPLVPAYTLNFGVDRVHGALQAGGNVALVGSRYLRGDEANDEPPLPAHATADLRVAYQGGRWQVSARARNLTDTRYTSFGGFNINQGAGGRLERFVTPGQPRSFEFSIQRSF